MTEASGEIAKPAASGGRFSRDAAVLFVSQIASLGLTFAAGVVTARLYPPELRGEYAMLTTVAAFVAVFANFGLVDALVYFHNRGEASRTATAAVVASAGSTALGLAISALLVAWLARSYFPVGGVLLAWCAVGSGLLAVFQRNALSTHLAHRRFVLAGAAGVAQSLTFLIALPLLGSSAFGTMAVVYAASWALSAAIVMAPLAPSFDTATLDRGYFRGVLSFCTRSYAHVVLSQLNYRLDLFVVGYLIADLGQLAFYHVAGSLTALLWLIPDSVGQAIYPRLAAIDDERRRTEAVVAALRHVLVITASGAAVLFVVSGWLVPFLFGDRYQPAVGAVHLLLPGAVLMAATKTLLRYLLSRNRHGLAVVASIAGVATNVVSNFVLVPSFGLRGAAFSASFGWTVTTVLITTAFVLLGRPTRTDWSAFPSREIALYVARARSALRERGAAGAR